MTPRIYCESLRGRPDAEVVEQIGFAMDAERRWGEWGEGGMAFLQRALAHAKAKGFEGFMASLPRSQAVEDWREWRRAAGIRPGA